MSKFYSPKFSQYIPSGLYGTLVSIADNVAQVWSTVRRCGIKPITSLGFFSNATEAGSETIEPTLLAKAFKVVAPIAKLMSVPKTWNEGL
jgi:hypothetical protein